MGIFLWSIVGVGILLCSPLCITLRSLQVPNTARLTVRFWGFLLYRACYQLQFSYELRPRIIKIGKSGKQKSGAKRRKARRWNWQKLLPGMRRLSLWMQIGVGDAAATALSCGVLKQCIQTLVSIYRLECLQCRILPDFETVGIRVWVHGIFRMRIVKIIGIILKEKRQNYAPH